MRVRASTMKRSSAGLGCDHDPLVAAGRGRLASIRAFVARDSARYATLVVQRITAAIDLLASSPQMGRVVPEIGDPMCARSSWVHIASYIAIDTTPLRSSPSSTAHVSSPRTIHRCLWEEASAKRCSPAATGVRIRRCRRFAGWGPTQVEVPPSFEVPWRARWSVAKRRSVVRGES